MPKKQEEKDTPLNSSFDEEEYYDQESPTYNKNIDLSVAADKPIEGYALFPAGLQTIIATKLELGGEGDTKEEGTVFSCKTKLFYNYTFELPNQASPRIFDRIYHTLTTEVNGKHILNIEALKIFGWARLKNLCNAIGFSPLRKDFNPEFVLFKPVRAMILHERNYFKEKQKLEEAGCEIITDGLKKYEVNKKIDQYLKECHLDPIYREVIKEYFPLTGNDLDNALIAVENKKSAAKSIAKFETEEKPF